MSKLPTTKDAAVILGYNIEYVRRLVLSGRLKGSKVANVWQVEERSVTKLRKVLERQTGDGISKHDPRRGRASP